MKVSATRLPARIGIALAVGAGLAVLGPGATIVAQHLGPHDVPTLFFVSKSDDRNRVDYGLHLDAQCRPRSNRAVFAYWRRFEPGQPPFGRLSALDQRAYGIASQHVASSNGGGTWLDVRIRSIPERRVLVLVRPDGDACTARARTRIAGVDAWIDHVHVQLLGPLMIDHVLVRGTDVDSGRAVVERRGP